MMVRAFSVAGVWAFLSLAASEECDKYQNDETVFVQRRHAAILQQAPDSNTVPNGFIDNTTAFCYSNSSGESLNDPRTLDHNVVGLTDGISNLTFSRENSTEFKFWCMGDGDGPPWFPPQECKKTEKPAMGDDPCPDGVTCKRGYDLMQWPTGANCTWPRILYIHGGSWTGGNPWDKYSFYYVHTSKIAYSAQAVVMSIDYPLIGGYASNKKEYIGNFQGILEHAKAAWKWLTYHGPNNMECSATPPPMFIMGDSSGGGSAMSLFLWLNKQGPSCDYLLPSGGPDCPYLPPSGGLFESPWTNLLSNSPSYYSNNAVFYPNKETVKGQIWKKETGAANATTASVAGDMVFQAVGKNQSTNDPTIISRQYALNGLLYCGNVWSLLSKPCQKCYNNKKSCTECELPTGSASDTKFGDATYLSCNPNETAPIDQLKSLLASPFWAKPDFFKGLPPMYFATSASELLSADTSVLAQNAGAVGVKATSELFYGMWHTFPQYSEGCGIKRLYPQGQSLWQGETAILHYGDFVKEVKRATEKCPGKLRNLGLEQGSNDLPVMNVGTGTRYVNSLRQLAGLHEGQVPLDPLTLNICGTSA